MPGHRLRPGRLAHHDPYLFRVVSGHALEGMSSAELRPGPALDGYTQDSANRRLKSNKTLAFAGDQTQVTRVTSGNTHHYTTSVWLTCDRSRVSQSGRPRHLRQAHARSSRHHLLRHLLSLSSTSTSATPPSALGHPRLRRRPRRLTATYCRAAAAHRTSSIPRRRSPALPHDNPQTLTST
jgi:hypothetical protein